VQDASANEQASAADLENMRLSMRAELAADYFQMLGFDMQAQILAETIAAYGKVLQLTMDREKSGIASKVDVVQAEAQLNGARAQLTDVQLSRSQLEHAIAVLTGRAPSSFSLAAGRIKNAPPQIPMGLPSQLLERRPDIASSERLVAAANAEIGLAKVAYYPSVSLTASGGLQSSSLRDLFSWPSRFWSLGASAAETLLDFGRRRALTQQAEANYDAVAAAYRQTVLSAFQEVEDQLSALRQLAQEQAQQEEAAKASNEALQLEIDRYEAGTVSYIDVINSQTIDLTNRRNVVALLQRRMTAAVTLIRAIGGGWAASSLPRP
jgi:NodT family efflux transporter outer membrane factor (OMF) lipoprotein